MKYISTGFTGFRIDESELLYMRLGQWAVSFEGYKYHTDNKRTLGPARGKQERYGHKLGITEQCDFNSNDWHSPRYDFIWLKEFFDHSRGHYPFNPHQNWKDKDKYMLWEPWAWQKQGFGTADNFWSAKRLMEESVW